MLLRRYDTMTTMTSDASNSLSNNDHVTGISQACVGLEPSEINHIIDAHRNIYERQRRYQSTYGERIKQTVGGHAKILQTKRAWYEQKNDRVRQYQTERMKANGEADPNTLHTRR